MQPLVLLLTQSIAMFLNQSVLNKITETIQDQTESQVSSACLDFVESLRNEMKENLAMYLSRLEVTDDMVKEYPFFADIPKFINDLFGCIQIEFQKGALKAQILIDIDQMQKYAFPPNLLDMLEYGTRTCPVIPFRRVSQQNAESNLGRFVQTELKR